MTPEAKAVVQVGAGGGSGLGLGVLIVWIFSLLGIAVPPEVGVVIGGLLTAGGASVGAWGIIGCCRRILWGTRPR